MTPDIFTVSELNCLIKDVVSCGFPVSLWVCGEIQNLDRYKSKAHLFFDLVEKNTSSSEIKAKLGVTIWAGVRPRIEALLRQAENAFELKDGIEVKFSGKVDFYPPYGTLRFVIDSIDPIYTLGKIAQDRQRLIAELTQKGILAKNKEKPLADVPLNIGLISAFDSAAFNDFLHELKKSGFGFQVSFFNAVMQGKNCETSVCNGLKALSRIDGLDAIIITRGGGSIADLSAFDSQAIAMAIASLARPVLTGIGHEINTSVTDLAAHTFAKTPTAIAHFLAERIAAAVGVLDTGCVKLFEESRLLLESQRASLRDDALALQNMTSNLVRSHKDNNIRSIQRLEKLPLNLCSQKGRDLTLLKNNLFRNAQARLKAASLKIDSIDKLVDMASPKRILKRGFSITRLTSGQLVRSGDQVIAGDELITEFCDTKITTIVK